MACDATAARLRPWRRGRATAEDMPEGPWTDEREDLLQGPVGVAPWQGLAQAEVARCSTSRRKLAHVSAVGDGDVKCEEVAAAVGAFPAGRQPVVAMATSRWF
jgi:hypothetical protein